MAICRWFLVVVFVLFFLSALPPCAADVPASQQLVNVSGLPGGGIVVDQAGRAAREGAVQINIPIAFTPSWGFAAVGAWKGGFAPPFRGRANPGISPSGDFQNGTGLLAAGFGPPGKGIYLGLMFLSS